MRNLMVSTALTATLLCATAFTPTANAAEIKNGGPWS
jgi:hypothetical protein